MTKIYDGYTQLWAVVYHEGKFWFNLSFTTYPFCAGSSGLKIYTQNDILYFDVESAIAYIQKPWNGELPEETVIHELKSYMSGYTLGYSYIPIQPNIQLRLGASL